MKGLRWYVAGLRDLADAIGIKIGTSVDGSEDWENPKYRSAATDNFNILAPAGSYLVSVLNQWGPRMATDFAKLAADNDMTICLGALAWHGGYPSELKNATDEQVKQFLQQRIRQILGFVRKGHKAHVDVVAEATWCIRETGVCGWEESPYYRVFGDNLISEVYVMAYKIAQEMGLAIGPNGDIEFLYCNYGTEMPGNKADFDYQQLLKAKGQIAKALGMDENNVQLSVSMQGHFQAKRDPERPFRFGVDELTLEGLKQTIRLFRNIGPVLINEVEIHGDPVRDNATKERAIQLIMQAAIEGGASEVIFYETLRFNQPTYDSGILNGLIDQNYDVTDFYREVFQLLSKYLQ
jgi:hypothetical protein